MSCCTPRPCWQEQFRTTEQPFEKSLLRSLLVWQHSNEVARPRAASVFQSIADVWPIECPASESLVSSWEGCSLVSKWNYNILRKCFITKWWAFAEFSLVDASSFRLESNCVRKECPQDTFSYVFIYPASYWKHLYSFVESHEESWRDLLQMKMIVEYKWI